MNRNRMILIASLFLPVAARGVALMAGDQLSIYFSQLTAVAGQMNGGVVAVVHRLGEGIGGVRLTGGDYEVIPSFASATLKLEKNLDKAHCYPNPYKPARGHTAITFSSLTATTNLKVFNIAGELVYRESRDTPTGELRWDAVNNNGEKLASGVYIYVILDNTGNKAVGKFAVIR